MCGAFCWHGQEARRYGPAACVGNPSILHGTIGTHRTGAGKANFSKRFHANFLSQH